MAVKNYNWNSANIANWNKITFPKNTKEKQIRKLESEITEWREAVTRQHKLEELADIFIASAGLTRFSNIGNFMCYLLQLLDDENKNKHVLHDAVDVKMNINRKRTFDEDMHHIGN